MVTITTFVGYGRLLLRLWSMKKKGRLQVTVKAMDDFDFCRMCIMWYDVMFIFCSLPLRVQTTFSTGEKKLCAFINACISLMQDESSCNESSKTYNITAATWIVTSHNTSWRQSTLSGDTTAVLSGGTDNCTTESDSNTCEYYPGRTSLLVVPSRNISHKWTRDTRWLYTILHICTRDTRCTRYCTLLYST